MLFQKLPTERARARAVSQMCERFDAKHGGFDTESPARVFRVAAVEKKHCLPRTSGSQCSAGFIDQRQMRKDEVVDSANAKGMKVLLPYL